MPGVALGIELCTSRVGGGTDPAIRPSAALYASVILSFDSPWALSLRRRAGTPDQFREAAPPCSVTDCCASRVSHAKAYASRDPARDEPVCRTRRQTAESLPTRREQR
ncbi:hypothetical protein MRX96_011701 [Rhipicephalus microplus]